jgi:hypothetical protein
MARVDYKNMIGLAEELFERHKLFEGMELVPLETYKGMDTRGLWEFKTPMTTGFYKPYTVEGDDKIEKLMIGELHYMKRAIYGSLAITATGEYDLPLFTCEFDQTAPRATIAVDFMPAVEMSIHQEYRERYYTPLAPLWRKYRTIEGLTKDGRCLLQRRYGHAPWARETLSCYCLDGKVEEEAARYQVLEAVVAYARVWLDHWREAKPVDDPGYKQEIMKRRKTIKQYYLANSPGGEMLKKLFDAEKSHLIESLLF